MQEVIASIILLISSLSSALWLLHHHKRASEEHHFRIRVFALSSLFISGYALSHLIVRDPNSHTSTLLQMTENLTLYISLPFIATIFIALSKGWHWSMAGWGRWLLGLIAFFELTRRTDFGTSYSYTLSLLVIAALLLSSIANQTNKTRFLLLAGTIMTAISTLVFSPTPLLMEEGNTAFFMLTLALSLPLLMASLHYRVKKAGYTNPPSKQ